MFTSDSSTEKSKLNMKLKLKDHRASSGDPGLAKLHEPKSLYDSLAACTMLHMCTIIPWLTDK